MVRRKSRPYEAYLRDQRRGGNSKGLLLEAGAAKRKSLLSRIVSAVFGRR